MGRIPQEKIDQVLDRTDIAEVIGGYIQLKKAGRSFKACCPFHNEKTPSFVVSPDKQIFHCFGCHAGGNAIGFVMKYENMEFPEALRMLAAKAGVDIPKHEGDRSDGDSISTHIYEINKVAASFYQNNLRTDRGKKALDYLKRRGLDPEILSEFRIGYAFDEWESLRKYSVGKNIKPDLLRKAGLTILSEKGKGDYDRFRNRITFPIFNERGSIIAFGGRVMDDSLPKYINSPETPVYSKSNTLYGINFSRKGIREKGHVIIVEGYMDVIVPFQHGIKNVVAASGTALTSQQAGMLKKYTDTAVMVFDADQAGEAASLRGLDILVEKGMNVKIVTLPQGDDPDSFVSKHGKEKFEEVVSQAKGLFDYKLDLLIGKFGIRDVGGISGEMLPTILKVSNAVVQSDCLKRLAERLGVHESSLRYELGKVKPDYSYNSETEVESETYNHSSSEIHLLGLALISSDMFSKIEKSLGIDGFRDRNIKEAMKELEGMYSSGMQEISPGKLLGRFEGREAVKSAVIQAIAKADITVDPKKELSDCLSYIRKENRDNELKSLNSRLKKAQEAHNDSEMKELLTKINKLHKEKVV